MEFLGKELKEKIMTYLSAQDMESASKTSKKMRNAASVVIKKCETQAPRAQALLNYLLFLLATNFAANTNEVFWPVWRLKVLLKDAEGSIVYTLVYDPETPLRWNDNAASTSTPQVIRLDALRDEITNRQFHAAQFLTAEEEDAHNFVMRELAVKPAIFAVACQLVHVASATVEVFEIDKGKNAAIAQTKVRTDIEKDINNILQGKVVA